MQIDLAVTISWTMDLDGPERKFWTDPTGCSTPKPLIIDFSDINDLSMSRAFVELSDSKGFEQPTAAALGQSDTWMEACYVRIPLYIVRRRWSNGQDFSLPRRRSGFDSPTAHEWYTFA